MAKTSPSNTLKPSIYDYQSSGDFLNRIFAQKKQKNSLFSLRAWAGKLGVKHPMTLSRMMEGKSRIPLDLIKKIARDVEMNTEEERYFHFLTVFEYAHDERERETYLKVLRGMNPQCTVTLLGMDRFRLIADWYHYAILEMTQLKDFRSDTDYICNRLGEGIQPDTVDAAIGRLLRLGLLTRSEEGELKRTVNGKVYAESKVPSEALRRFHLQMMAKAREALKSQPRDQRDFSASTLTLRKSEVPQAKQVINRFHRDLSQLSAKGNGDDTFQFNVQMFKVTEGQEA